MENSRQNTRFHWRDAKRIEALAQTMDSDGTNVELGGNLEVDGNFTADSIIENMSGYSFVAKTKTNAQISTTYAGIVKNGNKVTFVCTGTFQRSGDLTGWNCPLGQFRFPQEIGLKLYPVTHEGISALSFGRLTLFESYTESIEVPCLVVKDNDYAFTTNIYLLNQTDVNTPYLFRFEITFLLSDNLASE